MLQQVLAVCAESALRDAESNSMSVINIYEEFTATAFPIVIPKMSAVFVIERQPEDSPRYDAVVYVTLDGQELARLPNTRIDFQHATLNRHIVVIQGLQIPAPGRLQTYVTVGDQRFTGWTIAVKQQAMPSVSETTRLQ